MAGYSFTDIIWYVVVGWIMLVFLYLGVLDYLRYRGAKKLKYEWTWIMKKTTVSTVGEKYVSWDGDSSWYYLYRLEAKDDAGNIYRSKEFKNAEHWWRTLEEMVKKYDWVVYDLWNKEVVIRQINNNIQRLEMELSNDPWFFRSMSLKTDIAAMKDYIKIANEWPVNPYLICNGHKLSVWDSVDVYVSPEDSELYYFDLDFTQEQ